jgi:hypothetical protein
MTIIPGMDFYRCPSCGRQHGVWRVTSYTSRGPDDQPNPKTLTCQCGCVFDWRTAAFARYKHFDPDSRRDDYSRPADPVPFLTRLRQLRRRWQTRHQRLNPLENLRRR